MLFGDWFAIRAERLAEMMEEGPGSGPLRQTAAHFRELSREFETLASDIDSLLAQLASTFTGVASDAAAQAFRGYTAGLREMAAATDTVSQQADAQAEANDSARSSMPTLSEILEVLAALAAARASQNYGLVAALMAVYRILSTRASSTMQGYEAASLPNMQSPTPQQASPITNPAQAFSDPAGLLGSLTDQAGGSFASELMDIPPSSTLAELNGGGFGGGGGGFDGIPGNIGMTLGPVASLGAPLLFGLGTQATAGLPGPAGSPATTPTPTTMGGAPGMLGAGGPSQKREKERVANTKPDGLGVIVDPPEDEVPDITGIGVVADAGIHADAEAEQQA